MQGSCHMSLKAVVAAYAVGRHFHMNSATLLTLRYHESGGLIANEVF